MVSLIDGLAGTDVVLFENTGLPPTVWDVKGWSGCGLAALLIRAFWFRSSSPDSMLRLRLVSVRNEPNHTLTPQTCRANDGRTPSRLVACFLERLDPCQGDRL